MTATIRRTTRRIRNTRGSSYLTHGSDNYDHRGLNKAIRSFGKALIEESLSDDQAVADLERWKWVLTAEFTDDEKPWNWSIDVIGVYDRHEDLMEHVRRIGHTSGLDWRYIDINVDSSLGFCAQCYLGEC